MSANQLITEGWGNGILTSVITLYAFCQGHTTGALPSRRMKYGQLHNRVSFPTMITIELEWWNGMQKSWKPISLLVIEEEAGSTTGESAWGQSIPPCGAWLWLGHVCESHTSSTCVKQLLRLGGSPPPQKLSLIHPWFNVYVILVSLWIFRNSVSPWGFVISVPIDFSEHVSESGSLLGGHYLSL